MPRSTTARGGTPSAASPPPPPRGADAPPPPPLSPGALYEAERAARIAANAARMAQVLDAQPAGLRRRTAGAAGGDGAAAPPPRPKRKKQQKPTDADAAPPPPLRRSTRDRAPKPARRRARLPSDGGDEDDADADADADADGGDAPYSPGLTREERLARLEARGGAAAHQPWRPWVDASIPALALPGGSLNKALLADADEVRALSEYRAARMTLKGVANRVDKLTNLTKLADFIPVLRARAAGALAAGEAEEAVEYDRVADVAAAKLARMTAERE